MPPLPDHLTGVLHQLAAFCAAQGVAAWIVGGTARDIALGRTPYDLDIAVATDGVALARAFADAHQAAFVLLDEERGTGRVVQPLPAAASTDPEPRLMIDLVQLRAPTLPEDLRLRDFTINALALPLTAMDQSPTAFIDPCNGLDDLATRTLRPCSPTSLTDDPMRLLRAVRLAAELDLHIAPELDTALVTHAALITHPAAERVRDELLKLLAVPHAAPWLHYLDQCGLLTQIFPELEPARHCDQPIVHFLPVLAHSLETVTCVEWLLEGLTLPPTQPSTHPQSSALPVAVQTYPDLPRTLKYAEELRAHFAEHIGSSHGRAALFKLATLLHDNAKPQTKQPKPGGGVRFHGHQHIGAEVAKRIATRLRLSRQERAYVAMVVREHMRPGQLRAEEQLTPRAIMRFFRDTADAGADVLLHTLADHMATRGPMINQEDWRKHLGWTEAMLDTRWQQAPTPASPLINGHELMAALGLAPGRQVGQLLQEISEAQAASEITTPSEALDLARQILADAAAMQA